MLPLVASLALLSPPQFGPIELKEGLSIRGVVRSGRNPVFTDAVLASLIQNSWQAPKAGDNVFLATGDKREWAELKANADGSISGSAIQGGYAFFEVERPKPEVMVLESSGWGMVYVDGAPRAGDPYGFGYLKLPVKLNQGKTGFLFASGRGNPRAKLVPPPARAFFNLGDMTLPDLVVGERLQDWAGIVVVNATKEWATGLKVIARVGDSKAFASEAPPIPPLSFRKVPVRLQRPALAAPGDVELSLALAGSEGLLDFQKTTLRIRTPKQTRKVTFISGIDGSVQYYAVNPAQTEGQGKALVLTLHGASVEAIGQADAYQGKDWCHIVAPTNRRPYGFDWEEIGRRDALEVLGLFQGLWRTDPQQTYLTGHSMGGHGAWTVGFHYPDKWAAIAPAAGWISFFTYGGGTRQIPKTEAEEALNRAANASDTLLLLANSMHYPIYIHHGDQDDNVPVGQAREMKGHLDKLGHPSVTLHEVKGAGHWFGGESVDWPGIFDLFKTTKLKTPAEKDEVDFTSVNLSASSRAWWLQILQQEKPFAPSRAKFKKTQGRLVGTTENIEAIRFDSEAFPKGQNPRVIEIDGQTVSLPSLIDPAPPLTLQKVRNTWVAVDGRLAGQKRPEQMGPFKEVFQNNFCFVGGTKGSPLETAMLLKKARYDAEVFYYRGNGSVRILSDEEFLKELAHWRKLGAPPSEFENVVLYGNADTNAAWGELLGGSPIQVRRGIVQIGKQTWRGSNLACLFVRPRPGTDHALVAAVASTGPAGQRVAERIPYFTSGMHLPDWTVVSTDMLLKGSEGVLDAGFFRSDWGVPTR